MATKSFQIIDLISDDIIINKVKKFCITIYGKNENNENIACHVLDYLPYFYLKVPDTWKGQKWSTSDSQKLLKSICKDSPTNYYGDIKILDSLIIGSQKHKSQVTRGKDFYNLSWNKELKGVTEYNFFKACFTNLGDMKKVIQEIRKSRNQNNYEL